MKRSAPFVIAAFIAAVVIYVALWVLSSPPTQPSKEETTGIVVVAGFLVFVIWLIFGAAVPPRDRTETRRTPRTPRRHRREHYIARRHAPQLPIACVADSAAVSPGAVVRIQAYAPRTETGLSYKWSATMGAIVGDGSVATLKLDNKSFGIDTVRADVQDRASGAAGQCTSFIAVVAPPDTSGRPVAAAGVAAAGVAAAGVAASAILDGYIEPAKRHVRTRRLRALYVSSDRRPSAPQ